MRNRDVTSGERDKVQRPYSYFERSSSLLCAASLANAILIAVTVIDRVIADQRQVCLPVSLERVSGPKKWQLVEGSLRHNGMNRVPLIYLASNRFSGYCVPVEIK